MGLLRGFDVSHWQGPEDWPQWVRDYGITFGVAKATQGERWEDTRFPANWRGMKAAGIVRGAYDFAVPDSNPRDDVAHLLDTVDRAGGLDPTDLLVLDLERSSLSAADTAAWACSWADELKRATGGRFAAVLYCGGFMDLEPYRKLRAHFDAWWYPRYPARWANRNAWPASFAEVRLPAPNVWGGPPDFWQFSQSFPVAGDPHDANVYAGTLDQLRAINPGARPGPPPPPPGEDDPMAKLDPDDVQRIARAVWEYPIETRWREDGTFDAAGQPVPIQARKMLAAVRGVATAAAAKLGVRIPKG